MLTTLLISLGLMPARSNELILTTYTLFSSGPTYKANRYLESEYWGHANEVQVITGGRMTS